MIGSSSAQSAWPASSFARPATKEEVLAFGDPAAGWGLTLPADAGVGELFLVLARGRPDAEHAARDVGSAASAVARNRCRQRSELVEAFGRQRRHARRQCDERRLLVRRKCDRRCDRRHIVIRLACGDSRLVDDHSGRSEVAEPPTATACAGWSISTPSKMSSMRSRTLRISDAEGGSEASSSSARTPEPTFQERTSWAPS